MCQSGINFFYLAVATDHLKGDDNRNQNVLKHEKLYVFEMINSIFGILKVRIDEYQNSKHIGLNISCVFHVF